MGRILITEAAIIKDGKIYTGKRHFQIILDNLEISFHNCTQGFVDELDNFYTRQEAAQHAFDYGQIDKLKFCLISKDLW